MAAACPSSDEEDIYRSSSDAEDEDPEPQVQTPCRYYNQGGCRQGSRCLYPHVCVFAVQGRCRYGNRCRLTHPDGSAQQAPSAAPSLTDGRRFQWQLSSGSSWMDVSNDHVIEAQFSLPHRASITVFNTPYGRVTFSFPRMRVEGKDLRMRRLDDGATQWLWFCKLDSKWVEYGAQDLNGASGGVKSSDIEEQFQNNPTGSCTFNNGCWTFTVSFKDMQHVSPNLSARVARRPRYREKTSFVLSSLSAALGQMFRSQPRWQFVGDRGGVWCDFEGASAVCSLSSDDIERSYQLNPRATVTFSVWGQPYKLDLGEMTQTNLVTRNVRRIRRVLL
ncbi:uncharacterized protein LOC128756903 isoform X2 [Synchiropus splendidus]|uniref:uncharacterized protein LOC128756903 isoform X2 n=1 Tax=Synchiropus splendidus TaxID=270530 RepID=UPI00237E4A89|nr:uncharacterized protein LOC128756903 isoform X2 [Synchiropus splendidus]